MVGDGLDSAGWDVDRTKETMYVWRQMPEAYRRLGSLELSERRLAGAKVAVSHGIGFGQNGDEHVRFGLIENEHRTRQAVRGVRKLLRDGTGSI